MNYKLHLMLKMDSENVCGEEIRKRHVADVDTELVAHFTEQTAD